MMMRRSEVVEIGKGRDEGKRFKITEMDAEGAEWWAFRALQAIAGTDANINFQAPLAELAGQGLKALAKAPADQIKPLLDEMMACVKVVMPAGGERELNKGDIEEVATRVELRKAVFELHIGFFTDGEQQI
jgi:hypothetical protein